MGSTLILTVLEDLSANDIVIFLCVNESVECGLQTQQPIASDSTFYLYDLLI